MGRGVFNIVRRMRGWLGMNGRACDLGALEPWSLGRAFPKNPSQNTHTSAVPARLAPTHPLKWDSPLSPPFFRHPISAFPPTFVPTRYFFRAHSAPSFLLSFFVPSCSVSPSPRRFIPDTAKTHGAAKSRYLPKSATIPYPPEPQQRTQLSSLSAVGLAASGDPSVLAARRRRLLVLRTFVLRPAHISTGPSRPSPLHHTSHPHPKDASQGHEQRLEDDEINPWSYRLVTLEAQPTARVRVNHSSETERRRERDGRSERGSERERLSDRESERLSE